MRFVMLLLLLLGTVAPAAAHPLTVSLSNGITTVTCADGAACDASPLPGVVSSTSVLGTLTLSLTGVGAGSPALPAGTLDLAYSLTQSLAGPGGLITIGVSEVNQSSGLFHAVLGGTQSAGATALALYGSATNTLFALTSPICSAGPTSTPGAVALSCDGSLSLRNPISLTELVTIRTPAGAVTASGDVLLTTRIRPVPVPATMLLLGLGLLVVAVRSRTAR